MLTAEQQNLRKRGLGASEIPAVCGLNPWQSPLDIWLIKTGRAEPFAGNERTEMGNILEPHIIAWWQQQRAAKNGRSSGTVFDAEHDWLFATPDHIGDVEVDMVEQAAICEAKYVGFRVRDQWKENTTPEYVIAQVQIQQRVTGIHHAEVAAWIEGDYDPKRIVPCPYAPDLVKDLIEIGREFWCEYVKKDVPPPVDASESWANYLQKLFPKDRLPIVEAPPEADELAKMWLHWDRTLKHAKAQKDEAQNALELLIGERGGLDRRGKWRATWYRDTNGRPSWKAIAEKLSAMVSAQEFEALVDSNTGAPSRRFSLKEF